MLAMRVKWAGNFIEPLMREIFIERSSSGWRRASSIDLGNSAISSRNKMPWWASEISPGARRLPPPSMAMFVVL